MKLILGLGNPGEKYQNTRHNIGFMALDSLLAKYEPLEKTAWEDSNDTRAILKTQKKTFAHVKRLKIANEDVLIAKPNTFMNNSGHAAGHLLHYYKLSPSDMIVIYDEGDLPLGKIRIRFGGAAGGHRGVQNIIDVIGSDKFLRLRLGIGNDEDARLGKTKKRDLASYVLSPIEPKEKSQIKHMIKEAQNSLELILKHGLDDYMSRYNH